MLAGIGSMIGAGINIVPFALQRTVPGIGDHVLVAYLLAAIPAALAALCYAALGSAMPRAGGSYVYASRALGPLPGFIASFSQWVGLCMAIGVVAYLIPPFLRDVAQAGQWVAVATMLDQRTVRLVLALLLVWLFVLVNVRGVTSVTRTLVPLVMLMFISAGVVIIVGFSHDPAAYIASHSLSRTLPTVAPNPWTVIPPASAILFSSFIGFDAIAQAGGEARDPERSIPRAVILTLVSVGLFYFLFTAAVYHAVPWPYVAYAATAGDVTAPGLLAPLVSPAVAIVMVAGGAIALIKDLPGMILGVSRLCFAWADDGVFPSRIAQVHATHHTPHVALIVSALLASLSIVGGHLADDFFVGVDILVTAMLVNFLVMAVALLAIHRTNPALSAQMRVLRGRSVRMVVGIPALLLLTILLAVQIWRDLGNRSQAWYLHPTLVWLLVMMVGIAIYLRETRALARRGINIHEVTRVLPLE